MQKNQRMGSRAKWKASREELLNLTRERKKLYTVFRLNENRLKHDEQILRGKKGLTFMSWKSQKERRNRVRLKNYLMR